MNNGIIEFEKLILECFGINVPVRPAHLKDNNAGCYDVKTKVIYINAFYDFKTHDEVVRTLIHEGRHAWQDKYGLTDILPWHHHSKGFELYYNSYIERDARWASMFYEEGMNLDCVSPVLEEGMRRHALLSELMDLPRPVWEE